MERVHIRILVQDGFVPTELALLQDTLRIANRIGRDVQFKVELCSTEQGGMVKGIGGMFIEANPLPAENVVNPDFLIVLGGKGVRASLPHLLPVLRRFERMGQNMILMSDMASEWQRLYPHVNDITVHWEDQQARATADGVPSGTLPLYSRVGRVTTAAGMASTVDVILCLVVAPYSAHLARAVSNVLLVDKIRNGQDEQPRSENDVIALRVVKLEKAISAMESNIEDPLSMTELAATTGISIRQFERRFKEYLGQTPGAFYRSLRLRRARKLVEQTDMPISEISVACGFGSSSNFSKHFAREFGVSPTRHQIRFAPMAVMARTIPSRRVVQ